LENRFDRRQGSNKKRLGQLFGTEKKKKEIRIERMYTKDLEDLLRNPRQIIDKE